MCGHKGIWNREIESGRSREGRGEEAEAKKGRGKRGGGKDRELGKVGSKEQGELNLGNWGFVNLGIGE